MKKLLLTISSVFIISACGGGGGGGATAPAVTEDPVVVVVTDDTTSEPAEPITLSRISTLETVSGSDVVTSDAESSSDIVVPKGFDLETEQAFSLAVNHSQTDVDAYLSVCTDFEAQADGSFDINYDSCVMRTSLEFDTFQAEIAVTNDVTNLIAALWFMDTDIDPIYSEWALAEITD